MSAGLSLEWCDHTRRRVSASDDTDHPWSGMITQDDGSAGLSLILAPAVVFVQCVGGAGGGCGPFGGAAGGCVKCWCRRSSSRRTRSSRFCSGRSRSGTTVLVLLLLVVLVVLVVLVWFSASVGAVVVCVLVVAVVVVV